MTRQEAVERLHPSLIDYLDKWVDEVCETQAWVQHFSPTGDDVTRIMAKAAIAVLESQADLMVYLRENNELKNP